MRIHTPTTTIYAHMLVLLSACWMAGPALGADLKLADDIDADLDGFTVAQGDCNDNDPGIFPAAREICDGIDNNCNGEIDLDGPCETCQGPPGAQAHALFIEGAPGSRLVPAGALVHVNAMEKAGAKFSLPWEGLPIQADSRKWEQAFIMPDHDVSIATQSQPVDLNIESSTYLGTTDKPKTVYAIFPENPKGIIFMSHGTGGSAEIILKAEGLIWASRAVHRGFAVVSTDAEERAAGDLNGDQKIRWNAELRLDNIDFANINYLIESYINSGRIAPDLPRFAIGMSNGGSYSISMGTVAAIPQLEAAFPYLRFNAIASYCASGRQDANLVTETPTAWYMCGYDSNESVGEQGNIKALHYSQNIAARGIPTQYFIHPPAPLFDQRLSRSSYVNTTESTTIINNIRNAGYLSDCGYLTEQPYTVKAMMDSNPDLFPVYNGLTLNAKIEVTRQLKAAFADHEFYSAYADRNLDFFTRFTPERLIFISHFE